MTIAEGISAVRDADTRLIERLRRELAEVTADRDGLLVTLARIASVLGLPEGIDADKLIARIEEIA